MVGREPDEPCCPARQGPPRAALAARAPGASPCAGAACTGERHHASTLLWVRRRPGRCCYPGANVGRGGHVAAVASGPREWALGDMLLLLLASESGTRAGPGKLFSSRPDLPPGSGAGTRARPPLQRGDDESKAGASPPQAPRQREQRGPRAAEPPACVDGARLRQPCLLWGRDDISGGSRCASPPTPPWG